MAGENAVLDFEDSDNFCWFPEKGSINSSVCGC